MAQDQGMPATEMNTESIPTRKVDDGGMERPGDFCFDVELEHLYLWLPGRKNPDCIPIRLGSSPGGRIWGRDGNKDKPTLTPSISDAGNWHGYLTAGQLQSC